MLTGRRVNLLDRAPLLKRVLRARASQPVLMLLTLFVFTLAILSGIAGTPTGSRNFGIIFVWIVWWALLMIVLVPFFVKAVTLAANIDGSGGMKEAIKNGGRQDGVRKD